MKATLVGLVTVAAITVGTIASASAEDRGHHYGWRNNHHHSGISVNVGRSYARDCSVRITKRHLPNGTTVTRRVRSC
jgi:hypothetical protein